MKFILCFLLLSPLTLLLQSCFIKSKDTSTEQTSACGKLSSVDACLLDETMKGLCAYNHTTKNCIEKPKTLSWPNQTIAAGTTYICAVTVDGNVNCWFDETFSPAIQPEHLHPDQDPFATINAVSHYGYEEIMATSEKGKVFGAGGAKRLNLLAARSEFSKGPYSFAFTSYNRSSFDCALTAENNSLDCQKDDITGRFIRSVSAGFDEYCVVNENLAIECSGLNAKVGTSFNLAIPKGQFERIAVSRNFGAGEQIACAIQWTDGKLVCFSAVANAVTSKFPDIAARQVAVEATFAVALDLEGRLHFWGDEMLPHVKSLGDEIRIAKLTKFHTIAACAGFGTASAICAVKEDGTPVCFGHKELKDSLGKLPPFKVKRLDDIQFPLMP